MIGVVVWLCEGDCCRVHNSPPQAMKKSVVAKGRLAKVMVLRGSKAKTTGGLKASDLTKNKNGRVVSKKKSAAGKKSKWIAACKAARAALKVGQVQTIITIKFFVKFKGFKVKTCLVKVTSRPKRFQGQRRFRFRSRASPSLEERLPPGKRS